jgi:hypothetical protein
MRRASIGSRCWSGCGALAAAQQAEMVAFARSQVEAQICQIGEGRLDPAKVGRGIGDQIGLACRVSPVTGSRRLETARVLHADLPGIRALLAVGAISEDTAGQVVTETRHLNPEQRRLVDEQLCAARIEECSAHRAGLRARKLAYAVDPAGYVKRGRTARSDRRVTLRPAPDTMSLLTGFLPVEQGVACLAALRRHTDTLLAAGDARGRGQIMTDTLVERVTGQARAQDVNVAPDVSVEVGIVIPVHALVDPTTAAAGGTAGQVRDVGVRDVGARLGARLGAVRSWSGTVGSRPGSPATCSPAPRATAGGGGCSPPRPGGC